MVVRRPLVLVNGQLKQLPAGDSLEAAQAFFTPTTTTATATGQTSFAVGAYTPGAIMVTLNGATLAPANYTATDGANVVLASGDGVVSGTELTVWKFSAFEVANALPLGGTAADASKLGGQPPATYLNDLLSHLSAAEVSITAATTLDATAFGRMHVCSGTTGDYTVTLPAATGNAGKIIALRMSAELSKLVSVTAAGADLIDGQATRVMWAGESAVLLCTGTGWVKLAGVSKPLTCGAYPATAVTVAAAPTLTLVPLGATIFDSSGLMASLADDRIKILRPSAYRVSANIYYQSGGTAAATSLQCIINRNTMTAGVGSFTEWRSVPTTEPYRSIYIDDAQLSAGDYVQLLARVTGTARPLYVNDPTWTFLKISEVISW